MSDVDDPAVQRMVRDAVERSGMIVVLTGAGISAASGIPTFRGPEGYWTVGSAVYAPEEIATMAMFRRDPDAVWSWYLYRLAVCRRAQPNAAHRALVRLEATLGDRFRLITQNVDGLHQRAGSSPQRTYAVHGTLSRMRCFDGCPGLIPVPESLGDADRTRHASLSEDERALLTCPTCGGRTRPHVLWFDETYDEEHYRFDSALAAARNAALLLTVGTSGATTLPALAVRTALHAGAALVDVNPEPNPFADLAARAEHGAAVRAPAVAAVPALVDQIIATSAR